MKLPSLCYRKHVAYVSVGDDRETEDQRFDNEKIDSSLSNSPFCLKKTCALLEGMALSTHTVRASSLEEQASLLPFSVNKWL